MRSVKHDADNYIESGKTMASLMIKKLFSSEWLHLPRNKYDPALDNYLISPPLSSANCLDSVGLKMTLKTSLGLTLQFGENDN